MTISLFHMLKIRSILIQGKANFGLSVMIAKITIILKRDINTVSKVKVTNGLYSPCTCTLMYSPQSGVIVAQKKSSNNTDEQNLKKGNRNKKPTLQ